MRRFGNIVVFSFNVFLKFLRRNLSFALVLTAIVLFAEEAFYYYQYGIPILGLVFERYVIYIFLLSLVLSLIPWLWLPIVMMCALHVIQLMQALHVNYFGLPITPEILSHFFRDPSEDFGEIVASASLLSGTVFLLMMACVAASIIWIKKRAHANVHSRWSVLLLGALAIFPYNIATAEKPHKFYPQMAETLASNFINAVSLHALRDEFSKNRPDYLPYQLDKKPHTAKNIILIIGESCNPKYMSVLGYDQDSTPLLRKFALEQGEDFITKPMISTSVSTFPSITLLMNLIREPGNMRAVEEKQHNLIHMAHNNGFKAAWIGDQSANNLVYAGLEKADFVLTSQMMNSLNFTTEHDDRLLEELSRYQWSDAGNFIVIHQRNLHSPYETNYAHHKELQMFSDEEIAQAPDRATHAKKTYLNAMRYNDYTLYNIMSYLKKTLRDKGESYVFYTSDHGELLGEDGLYGHSHLKMPVAQVPFIMTGINADAKFMEKMRSVKRLTHYDLGVIIAEKLGYHITNPNMHEGVYYIHSPDLYSGLKYIEYHLDGSGEMSFQQEYLMGEQGVK